MKKHVFFVLILFLSLGFQYSQDQDYLPWWIYNHGDYSKTGGKHDPRVKRAIRVFQNICRVADKTAARMPRLLIINTRGGDYAIALPDGGIIINPDTLDICYGTHRKTADRNEAVHIDTGDTRLAFVMGHELAHLAHKDFMSREAFQAVRNHGSTDTKKKLNPYYGLNNYKELLRQRNIELMADKEGLVYAAIAGYDVGRLFVSADNFLALWARSTGIKMQDNNRGKHPSFRNRLQFIRPQLKELADKLEYFSIGTLFYHLQMYNDAAEAFKEFAKLFPSREALNNIGACYLAPALEMLHRNYSQDYFRFQFSTSIDCTTTAENLTSRKTGSYLDDKNIVSNLELSVKYFRSAVKKDPLHKSSRYNLSTALILLGRYDDAFVKCNEVLKQHPGDIAALNNKAVALYYMGESEKLGIFQKVLQLLQEAHRMNPNCVEVVYNLASMNCRRKRMATAKLYWNKFLNIPNVPRDSYYHHVYKKQKGKPLKTPAPAANLPTIPGWFQLSDHINVIEKKWGKKQTRIYPLGGTKMTGSGWSTGIQVLRKDKIRVLAIDKTIEMVEVQTKKEIKTATLLKKYGPPTRRLKHSGGSFYIYDHYGFSIKSISGIPQAFIFFVKPFDTSPSNN